MPAPRDSQPDNQANLITRSPPFPQGTPGLTFKHLIAAGILKLDTRPLFIRLHERLSFRVSHPMTKIGWSSSQNIRLDILAAKPKLSSIMRVCRDSWVTDHTFPSAETVRNPDVSACMNNFTCLLFEREKNTTTTHAEHPTRSFADCCPAATTRWSAVE